MEIEVRNPKYNVHGTIDVEINHPAYGWIPFTAAPNDVEPHGRAIFGRCIAGEVGPVAAYEPPVLDPVVEAEMVRQHRDMLLAQSDWTQLPDVPEATSQRWATYRQALRDITGQSGFPLNVIWPQVPA